MDELGVNVGLVELLVDWVRLEEAEVVMLNVGLALAEGVIVPEVLKEGLGVIVLVADIEMISTGHTLPLLQGSAMYATGGMGQVNPGT